MRTFRRNFRALDGEDFGIRRESRKAMQNFLRQQLEESAYVLQDDVRALIDGRALPHCSAEQAESLKRINDYVEAIEFKHSGKMNFPGGKYDDLRMALEKKFGMQIIPTLKPMEDLLALCGMDSECPELHNIQAIDALHLLCEKLNGIPRFTHIGMIIMQRQKLTLSYTSGHFFVTHTMVHIDDKLTETITLFHAPDKGAILSIIGDSGVHRADKPHRCLEIPSESVAQWSSTYKETPQPNTSHSLWSNEAEILIGTHPETVTLDCQVPEGKTVGPQRIWLRGCREAENGWWEIELQGANHDHVPWPSTSFIEDADLYQLTAANNYEAIDESGKVLPTRRSSLIFSERRFTQIIRCIGKPVSLNVRMFTQIEEQKVSLRERELELESQ